MTKTFTSAGSNRYDWEAALPLNLFFGEIDSGTRTRIMPLWWKAIMSSSFLKPYLFSSWVTSEIWCFRMNDIIQFCVTEFTYLVGTKLVGMGCLSVHRRHGLIGHGSFGQLLVLMFPTFAT